MAPPRVYNGRQLELGAGARTRIETQVSNVGRGALTTRLNALFNFLSQI